MENRDKAANSANAAYDKIVDSTHQAGENLGEKVEQLKKAEQQLIKYYRSYIRYNPWVSQ
jgi:ElaB/YqjD/DUF883 family membrane-anchored ribosome-binding protein